MIDKAEKSSFLPGVSLVVCCHNSAERLPQTLGHLAAQHSQDLFPWEVILVDNASTDNTSLLALSLWPDALKPLLRIVQEPRLGLSNARQRGLKEARYEYVSFIDDDNWICEDWVRTVYEVMTKYPGIGACGGASTAVCDVELPDWFDRYKEHFAVGHQSTIGGDITRGSGLLWGAGLNIRKSAWQDLLKNDFTFLLPDRKGKSLSSGGDTELCFALALAGLLIWYEPRLLLKHYLPPERLTWEYLKQMYRSCGVSGVDCDAYYFALNSVPTKLKERLRQTWHWQACRSAMNLFRLKATHLLTRLKGVEFSPEELRTGEEIGRLNELLRKKSDYDKGIRAIRNARWNKFRRHC